MMETMIDPECTFRPQRIAKMDAWVTSKYMDPRAPPRPRAEPVLSFQPSINRNVAIHASEPNVYNRLYADRIPRPAKDKDTPPVATSSKLSKAAIDACIARQNEYLAETQRRQRALRDATVYPFRPHINPRSQRLATRFGSMNETLYHAQRRRESKLSMLLAPEVPRSVGVVDAVAQAKATARLSRPKDAYYVPDSDTAVSSVSGTSIHAATLLYEKLQEQHMVQRHVSLRQHVDAILDDYARAS